MAKSVPAVVLVVAHAEAEDGQENALMGAFGDEGGEFGGIGDADVEIAVGAEDDAVVAIGHEVVEGLVVGEPDAGAAGGAAAGLEAFNGGVNGGEIVAGGGRQDEAGGAGVDDDGNAVLRRELSGEKLDGLLDERQLVFVGHRSGNVEQEDEVAGRAGFGVELLALERDLHERVRLVPRARGGFDVDGEGHVALGRRIVVGEIIDHFLDAHRVGRRHLAGAQEAPDVRVGRRIHVDGEGG